MAKYQIIEPGTDILKLDTRRPKLKIPWLWIGGIAFAAMIVFLLYGKSRSASAMWLGPNSAATTTATIAYNGDFTRTPTPAGLASPTPTVTATGYLAAIAMPNVEHGTRAPSAAVNCEKGTSVIRVEVTRVVPGSAPSCPAPVTIQVEVTRKVEVTRVVTQVVPGASPTPGPTSTPWVIVVEVTRVVEVTSTPTETPTVTPEPTLTETPLPPSPTSQETGEVLQVTLDPSPTPDGNGEGE